MDKFNPKAVPNWCKWIAVDEDGTCYGFKIKPTLDFDQWGAGTTFGKYVFLYRGERPKNWKDELYTWS